MAELDLKTKEMVAMAAAIAGNCIPCLKYHAAEAIKAGCTSGEMREVVRIAKMVKQVPIDEIDKTIVELLGKTTSAKGKEGEEDQDEG